MSEQLTGKATAELFEQVILRRLGAPDPDVLVGPRHGVDVGVVRVADGVAMALTTDPVFVVPAYGWERAAWFAVHILASDAATSGLPLRWMAVDLNLPPEVTDAELTALWDAFLARLRRPGHRGGDRAHGPVRRLRLADGGGRDVHGARRRRRVRHADDGAARRPVVVTKGAAIEATALFAATFPDRLRAGVGHDVVDAADALFERMTVVPEAVDRAGVRPPGPRCHLDARRDRGGRARRPDSRSRRPRGPACGSTETRSRCRPRCGPSATTSGSTRTRRSARAP